MQQQRTHFGQLGVILATAGSAVGLGNIWRFPYMTGQNGGAAFILVYLACVFMLGIPGMVAEFIVGRRGAANAARAYRRVGGSRNWGTIGYLGVITAIIILGFYAVVSGWCLQYVYASVAGSLRGDASYVEAYFQEFSSSAVMPVVWAGVFLLLTHVVITRGVRNGIERASKLLMPTLFVLLIVIVVASCMLPGAMAGVEYLFKPDFSHINSRVILDALGQAFFSLSLGTACLCTYASYFSPTTNLLKSALQIASIDCLIAILAGLMIFPAAASVGVSADSGPSLIFITLPNVFQQAFSAMPWVGRTVSVLFYALLSLAALTSTISMHEIGTAFFAEELKVRRSTAATIVTLLCLAIATACSLSIGAVPGLRLMGFNIMDFCDLLTANVLLPLGSILTCVLLGWFVPRHILHDEFTNHHTLASTFFRLWLFAVRYVCPTAIIAIFLHKLGWI